MVDRLIWVWLLEYLVRGCVMTAGSNRQLCSCCVVCVMAFTGRPISVLVLRFWFPEGLTQQNLNFKGWNYHVHRDCPGSVESTNLSRDDLSGETGHMCRVSD